MPLVNNAKADTSVAADIFLGWVAGRRGGATQGGFDRVHVETFTIFFFFAVIPDVPAKPIATDVPF